MKKKDPYYEKLSKEFKKKDEWKNKWIKYGWGFFYLFIFLIASYQGFKIFQDVQYQFLLYISFVALVVSIIILIIGYTKKKSS